MRRDTIYVLSGGKRKRAFGNLKTLVTSIGADKRYSTIRRGLISDGEFEYGRYFIEKMVVERAVYIKN